MKKLTIAFMGTPEFAVPALAALYDTGHSIAAVYSQPPRRAGRGKAPRPTPVAAWAEAKGLEVRTPASLRDPGAQTAFRALGLDAAVVAAYGLILPPEILEAPRLGCINIHASLLPRWRGAAPVQRAIMVGDAKTGISIMQMDAGLDTGPVLAMQSTPIETGDTAGSLTARLSHLGAAMIVEALAGLAAGTLEATPQPESGASYAKKIDKAEAAIDWRRPADELARLVRAMNPVPGAWFEVQGERIKVLGAEVADGNGPPGTVLDERLTVACGQGALRLLTVQRAGKGPADADAFLRGFPLPPGMLLGSAAS